MLAENHPDLFEEAIAYEENHSDGRNYTWTQGETLRELIARKDEIIAKHEKALRKETERSDNQPLVQALEAVLDEEDMGLPCLTCHL